MIGMARKARQKMRVLKYLEDFGSITQLDAMADIGVMRLSGRIYELRRDGWPIISIPETRLNRYNEKVRFTRYRMAA